jgi:hypothetical protein
MFPSPPRRRTSRGGRTEAVVQRLFDAINSGNLDELPQVVARTWSTTTR